MTAAEAIQVIKELYNDRELLVGAIKAAIGTDRERASFCHMNQMEYNDLAPTSSLQLLKTVLERIS